MLRFYLRPLAEADQRILAGEVAFLRRQRTGLARLGLIGTAIVLALGIPFILNQAQEDPNLLYLGVVVLFVYLSIIAWVYRDNIRDNRRRARELESAIGRNEARVLRCRATGLVTVIELEDEGPGYFFEVEDGRILYLGGQLYYPTSKFPNSDFEVIEVLGIDGLPVSLRIECYGEKLEPVRTIDGQAKLRMTDAGRLPEDMSLFPGPLETLETRILDGSARPEPLGPGSGA